MLEDELKKFFQWMDIQFPADDTKVDTQFILKFMTIIFAFFFPPGFRRYATRSAMAVSEGGVFLRPWHLNFYPDAGFRGYADPALLQAFSFTQTFV